jgi:2'-5' RNA ligase
MPRLFTGLEIPQSVAQSLAMMRGGLPGARWIDAENYHLTLRFIGDIDDALAREIAGVLARVHRRPFELRLDGLTSFGGRKPRALVAAAAPVPPLMELQAEHDRLLQRLGLEPEGRKYTPHVTLAPIIARRRFRCRALCCSPHAPPSAAGPISSRKPIRSPGKARTGAKRA